MNFNVITLGCKVNQYESQVMRENLIKSGSIKINNTIKKPSYILKENDLDVFSKSYFGVKDKAEVCVKEKIDLMIDDSYEHCSNIAKEKIKTIYLKDAATYDLEENEYIKVLYNWGEIYRYIREM